MEKQKKKSFSEQWQESNNPPNLNAPMLPFVNNFAKKKRKNNTTEAIDKQQFEVIP
jgi:hypothetical protein